MKSSEKLVLVWYKSSANVNLSNPQLNKVKSATGNETRITQRTSLMISSSNDDANFPYKLLLIDKLHIFIKSLQVFYQLI